MLYYDIASNAHFKPLQPPFKTIYTIQGINTPNILKRS